MALEKTDFEARVSTTVDVQEGDPSLEGTRAASWAFVREPESVS